MRTSIVLVVFLGGLLVGVVAMALMPRPAPVESPYPALGAVPEPPIAAAVAQAVESGDAASLAAALDEESVRGLGRAIGPVPIIEEVRFSGTAALGDNILVGYLVIGSDGQGPSISGFTVTVDQGGTVVGIR
jgi:hypothetical protein